MKSSPIILAGVQHPGANPFAINRSTIAKELKRSGNSHSGWRCGSPCFFRWGPSLRPTAMSDLRPGSQHPAPSLFSRSSQRAKRSQKHSAISLFLRRMAEVRKDGDLLPAISWWKRSASLGRYRRSRPPHTMNVGSLRAAIRRASQRASPGPVNGYPTDCLARLHGSLASRFFSPSARFSWRAHKDSNLGPAD